MVGLTSLLTHEPSSQEDLILGKPTQHGPSNRDNNAAAFMQLLYFDLGCRPPGLATRDVDLRILGEGAPRLYCPVSLGLRCFFCPRSGLGVCGCSDVEERSKVMSPSTSLTGLMKWLRRDPWRDAFNGVLESYLGPPAQRLELRSANSPRWSAITARRPYGAAPLRIFLRAI